MVRAVAQIEQEIAALDQTAAAVAQAFYDAYGQYLAALGQAVRQQLVLAAYYICTNSYPEQFMKLTLGQRQTLQQALRQLAQQAQSELVESLYPVSLPDSEPKLLSAQAEIERRGGDPGLVDAPGSDSAETLAVASDLATDQFATADPSANQSAAADIPAGLAELRSDLPAPDPARAQVGRDAESEPVTPRDIAHWQSDLEDEILEVLQTISHATNQVLQQAKILPDHLPEPILEVAAKADLSSETAAGPPNLLNLLIESNEDPENAGITQVVAVRLRLSEVEFGDPATAAQRSKLRHLLAQLSKLGREYQRRQKERSTAQAEAAWRAIWYDAD